MGEMVQVGEVQLYVEVVGEGSGTPVLLLHGGLGFDHTYLRVFDRLATSGPMIYVDHRGNGRSDPSPESSIRMATFAHDAVEACRALGHDTFDVVGHSYGGFIAQELAVNHPDVVRRLVLIDTFPAASAERMSQVMAMVRTRDPGPEVLAALNAPPSSTVDELRARMTTILPMYVHRVDVAELAATLGETRFRVDGRNLGDAALDGWDIAEELQVIAAPTLVICGRHDWICPLPQSEIIASRIPAARLEVFDESGHFPWIEEPDQFWPVIEGFLATGSRTG